MTCFWSSLVVNEIDWSTTAFIPSSVLMAVRSMVWSTPKSADLMVKVLSLVLLLANVIFTGRWIPPGASTKTTSLFVTFATLPAMVMLKPISCTMERRAGSAITEITAVPSPCLSSKSNTRTTTSPEVPRFASAGIITDSVRLYSFM